MLRFFILFWVMMLVGCQYKTYTQYHDPDGGTEADAGAVEVPGGATLSALSMSSGTLEPAFAPSTTNYTAQVPNGLGIQPFTVKPATSDPNATIVVNGTVVASGAESPPITLPLTKPTPIDVAVSAPGKETTHYTLVATAVAEYVYVKASNTRANALFGHSVALFGDTLAVGSVWERGTGTGINGDQSSTSSAGISGAVYIYVRIAGVWSQQAYIKPSNNYDGMRFGVNVALYGNTLAVGASGERNVVSGINVNPNGKVGDSIGAVYVFTRIGETWTQQAYIKASNARELAYFGGSVALFGDTLAVGSFGETSAATGINMNESDTSTYSAGAVYLFTRTGTIWSQQAYIKASNTRKNAEFGKSVALYGDTLAVGSDSESSATTGINGNQADASLPGAGAVYVFSRTGITWVQEAYIKPSETRNSMNFATNIALFGDVLAASAGAKAGVYVFTRTGTTWSQQAIVNGPDTIDFDSNSHLALEGDTLVVGSPNESSVATGINGNQTSHGSPSGAAFLFRRKGTTWAQQTYIKASFNQSGAYFGSSVAISGDTLAVGSEFESSAAIGINQNQKDHSADSAGAVYVIR